MLNIRELNLFGVETAGELDGEELGLVIENSVLKVKRLADIVAQPWLAAPRANRIKHGNLGTRILSARMGTFDNSTVKTFRAIIEVAAAGFDAVRPIFANGNTGATYTVAGCNVRALADTTSALPSATAVTLPSSGVVPVAIAGTRRSFLLGNWTDLASVARTDGGTGALVCIDAYVSTNASITIMGNGTDPFTNWATRTNRKWIMRYNDGDCVTTPANFTSTTNRSQSPIIGVQYLARGRVITVMGVGDSITDGRGTYLCEGFGVPACESVSSQTGTVFEWVNCGRPSESSSNFRYFLSDACAAGIVPDVVVISAGSPNNTGATIAAAEVAAGRFGMAHLLRTAKDYNVHPVIWTWPPINASVKAWGSSDALRTAYNAAVLQYADLDVMDFADVLEGATLGSGQIEFGSGLTTDGVHPNDAGNAVMSPLLAAKLQMLLR